ncbi:Soluble scavenger receptor cysteine-rich domain-containing protein SSC5D [Myotis davidii]|uniref:Soluble scavenger receptor cysteine-rich domain-containing protein SSC5D n=1 Tax=Myotis davidii TaxID=225400 RepID=L5LDB7_MYODS|nr:Soluble scavenger receptor cysteine-rich domain-containing protein SSC5D [Myotis davidii]
MAPSHLSVREMREDEKALVLEMLKAGVKDTENRVALHALTRPPTLLLLAAASSGLRFVLASFALALLLPVLLAVVALKLGLRARPPPGWDPPEQLPEKEPPAAQAGQVHQGPAADGRSPPPGNNSKSGTTSSRPPPPTARPALRTADISQPLTSPTALWEPGPEAGTPGLDSIADPFSWSWLPDLGRDPDDWLPGEPATKPPAGLSSTAPERTTQAPGKMPKSTKKWVTKHPKRPATPAPRTPTTKHSRSPGTRGPPELTSQTTAALTTEAPRKLTSHTSTTPTPRTPWERTSKTMTMTTTQDPGEVTSLSPVEPSAKTPAEGPSVSSKDPAPSPTGGSPGGSGPFRVRLADGPNRCAGRLEVWHAGLWGTVCDDKWDLRDSTVACGELGCGRVRPRVGKTHYGPGTGPIWLDDVGCKGTEASLSDCPAGPWGQHNCGHEEDVVLTCTGTGAAGAPGDSAGAPPRPDRARPLPISPKATPTRRTTPPGPGTPPPERTWPRAPLLQGRLDTLPPGAAPGALGSPPQR